jgi:hypothetical protein
MMEREEAIREAAQAIRPYLGSLVGAEAAAVKDAELANLLGGGAESDRLLAALTADERTRQWWLDFLRFGGLPPEIAPRDERVRVRGELPGLGLPVLPRYACPRGDYVWYRRSPAIPVDRCPTHGVPLRVEPRSA